MERVAFPVILAYLWVMMILLGAIVLETFMVYPNIFHDPPRSLETAMEFMAVRAPNDFFPPLGFLSWLTGIAAVISGWRVEPARYWLLGGVIMMLCEGLFSMAFFWPRNEIMFVEGTEVHSAAYLRQVAQEFQTLHWSRLAFNAVGSASVFVGFLRFYRHRITSRDAHHGAQEATLGRAPASDDKDARGRDHEPDDSANGSEVGHDLPPRRHRPREAAPEHNRPLRLPWRGPLAPVLITMAIAVVWVGAVVATRAPNPLTTLAAAGGLYGVFANLLQQIMWNIVLGGVPEVAPSSAPILVIS